MSQLPIHKLTLYKQGIGYFERRGEVEDKTVSLVVSLENINDTLKSLTITSHNGGQVLGVDYETPADKETVLDELSVKLADRSSMIDLLSSLRGSHVTLRLDGNQTAIGRLVGVETSLDAAAQSGTILLQDDADKSNIQVWPLIKLQGLTLHDERAANDVSFFLDVSQTEQTRTTLTIQLSEGKHDLEIGYLTSSPTWRVSYQLLSSGQNKARLLGWGVFDNFLDEDLDNVMLTLRSGRPISFEYDLYKAYIPSRPQVSDDPLALETISDNPLIAESIASISHEIRTPINSIIGFASILQQEATGPLNQQQKRDVQAILQGGRHLLALINDLLSFSSLQEKKGYSLKRGFSSTDDTEDYSGMFYRSGPLGNLKVSGAYFKPMLIGNAEPELLIYDVETPVSVRRNQSAMVPIIDRQITYDEICVYNGGKMPNHPLRVWRLRNTTGKALEQGPVTLVEDGEYLGEGLIQFTGVDDEMHIPYALEFGIVVSEHIEQGSKGIYQIEFDSKKRQAVVKRYEITEYVYTLTSHVEREMTVLIERRDSNFGEYYQMPDPVLAVEGHTRWSVDVPANGENSFTVQVRTVQEQEEDITNWDAVLAKEMYNQGILTEKIYTSLDKYWSEQRYEVEVNNEVQALRTEYDQLLLRQQQLRQNLGALGESEREVTIRNRILDDLETSENRRRELEINISELDEKIKQHQSTQTQLINEIYSLE